MFHVFGTLMQHARLSEPVPRQSLREACSKGDDKAEPHWNWLHPAQADTNGSPPLWCCSCSEMDSPPEDTSGY